MKIVDNDISAELQKQVKQAISNKNVKQALFIHGGKSKQFFGAFDDKLASATPLDTSQHTGVINYEPTELCITVRSGTKLSELEVLLAENNQVLAFEPPHYLVNNQDTATIGGAIASGISGPRRADTGSVRDSILGVEIINGHGEMAKFGGEVMKNVAGYDLSRMMVRSQGTLGVILNISLRVIPKPEQDMTLVFDATQSEALAYFQGLRKQLLPMTATAWIDGKAMLRLSASGQVLQGCKDKVQGEELPDSQHFWHSIRDHTHSFFNHDKPLWRFSLPPATTEKIQLDGEQLIEWSGAQRWIHSLTPANIIRDVAKSHKGYATLFNSAASDNSKQNNTLADIEIFTELDPVLFTLHKSLKSQMDPHNIFNPNRIYKGL